MTSLEDAHLTLRGSKRTQPRPPRWAAQEAVLRGEVELAIGAVLDGDPAYLFDGVRALARDPEGLIYVADSGSRTVRVFDHRGRHVVSFGGRGQGPGEFRVPLLCGLAFDPDGRLWVNQTISFEIFRVGAGRVSYLESFVVRDPGTTPLCGNPMFAGPTGITVPRRGPSILGAKDEHVQVTENGEVWGRVPNVHSAPDFGVWKWPVMVIRSPALGTNPGAYPPPFAARVLVAHAPDGGFAQVFSPVYDIRVHGPDGTQKARVQSDRLGPLVTEGEMREGYEELANMRDVFRSGGPLELLEYTEYRIPERKPVIDRMWYDDDGRLWVCFWPAEADTMRQAHVYDADGAFLHEAEWPLGIAIWYGGLSGDVAVGVRKVEFDVEQVVRLRFLPQPAPNPPSEP